MPEIVVCFFDIFANNLEIKKDFLEIFEVMINISSNIVPSMLSTEIFYLWPLLALMGIFCN